MSNVFSFTGTCARDSEVRYTQSGMAILSFSVANNTGYGDKKKTMWIRVTTFGKRAEGSLKDYLKKGQNVFVSGELSQNEYEKDGMTKTSLELNATIIELVGSKNEASQPQKSNTEQRQPDNFDDDIPF